MLMSRTLRACAIVLVLLLVACGEDAPTPTPPASATGPLAPLPNSTPPVVRDGIATKVGALDSSQFITFDVLLKIPDADELKKITDPNDKEGVQAANAVNQKDFDLKYAPKAALAQLQAYVTQSGLQIVKADASKLAVSFKGTVAQIQKLFGVSLNKYSLTRKTTSSGAPPTINNDLNIENPDVNAPAPTAAPTKDETITFYANDKDVNIPSKYIPFVDTINLTDLKLSARKPSAAGTPQRGYAPASVQTAYNVNPLYKAGIDGSGQYIAVYAQGGYKDGDLKTFASKFNLPAPKVEVIPIDDADTSPNDDSGEVTLDIEAVMAVAPKATILLYVSNGKLTAMSKALIAAADDGRAHVFSISYGLCELALSSSVAAGFETAALYARSRALMSIYVSSGDDGAYDCARVHPSIASKLSVDFPSSSPNAVAVGGTSLFLNNGQYDNEQTWGDSAKKIGTGGGISQLYKQPDFQKPFASLGTTRLVPDVAAIADPRTGMFVYCTVTAAECGGWQAVGGTSLAAPVVAAGAVLVNQYLNAKFKDYSNGTPLLYGPKNFYQLQKAQDLGKTERAPYRDVTEGSNFQYKAAAGYDLTTGLGTPDFAVIANNLEVLYNAAGFK